MNGGDTELANHSVFVPAPYDPPRKCMFERTSDPRGSVRRSVHLAKFGDFMGNLSLQTGLLEALPPPPPPLEMNFNRPFKPLTRNRYKPFEQSFFNAAA